MRRFDFALLAAAAVASLGSQPSLAPIGRDTMRPLKPKTKKAKTRKVETLEQRRNRKRKERDDRLCRDDFRERVRADERAKAEIAIPGKYLHSAARRRRQAETER